MTTFPEGSESKGKARWTLLQPPQRKAPRSPYIADVLQGSETEGRQVVSQGLANACCVPALGQKGEKAIKVTEARDPGKCHTQENTQRMQHYYRCLWLETALGIITIQQTRYFSSHHPEACHRENSSFSLWIPANTLNRSSCLLNRTIC